MCGFYFLCFSLDKLVVIDYNNSMDIEKQITDIVIEKSMPPLWKVGDFCIYNYDIAEVAEVSEQGNEILKVNTVKGNFIVDKGIDYCFLLTLENKEIADYIGNLYFDILRSNDNVEFSALAIKTKMNEFLRRIIESPEAHRTNIKNNAKNFALKLINDTTKLKENIRAL